MEANYIPNQFDICTNEVWEAERNRILEGKGNSQLVCSLQDKLEPLIISAYKESKVQPFTSDEMISAGIGNSEYLKRHIKEYKAALKDSKERALLVFFNNNNGLFAFDHEIVIRCDHRDYIFWLLLKLRSLEKSPSKIRKLLEYQAGEMSKRNKTKFVQLLFDLLIDQEKLLNIKTLTEINDWRQLTGLTTEVKAPAPLTLVKGRYRTFYLKILDGDPEFFQSEKMPRFKFAFDELIEQQFLDGDTKWNDFTNLFLPHPITEKKQVVWKGTYGDLKTFVMYLAKSQVCHGLDNTDRWLIAQECFKKRTRGKIVKIPNSTSISNPGRSPHDRPKKLEVILKDIITSSRILA